MVNAPGMPRWRSCRAAAAWTSGSSSFKSRRSNALASAPVNLASAVAAARRPIGWPSIARCSTSRKASTRFMPEAMINLTVLCCATSLNPSTNERSPSSQLKRSNLLRFA